ncbi:P-loop NTPase fold protein [Methylobacter sp. sgz302048]|uniref:P-loop NTPase fold protein n=1 Tax=Methylobacter sp. sgz302048 TaxID=3455945 RepID=UPI003FA18E57
MSFNSDMTSDILDAIRAYIAADRTPYAIAIDGEWGVGKTYLVQNAIGDIIDDSNFLYVSLYGLSSIDGIESAIFTSASRLGEDDAGIFSGLLNTASSELTDGVRIGGLGYAVQYGLRKWKKRALDQAKKLTLCFDDIERWQGDIGVCLGYINGLAEHDGTKCILVGDLSKIPESQRTEFQRARTKTVRYVYTLAHSPTRLLSISLDIASIGSLEAKEILAKLISENTPRMIQFLEHIKCQNIRLLADAFQLCGDVAMHNLDAFHTSPTKALAFFEITLAATKLVQMKAADGLFLSSILKYDDRDALDLMKKLGYDPSQDEDNSASPIPKALLEAIFYSSEGVRVSSIINLVTGGFYRPSAFVDFFDNWKAPEPFEYYIDTFKFWYLPDDESKKVFEAVISSVFDEKSITHPGNLLRIADRLTSDIKRGVVDLDFEQAKKGLIKLIDELYDHKKMEYVVTVGERLWSDNYLYSLDILEHVRERNTRYLSERDLSMSASVWSRIKETPDEYLEILDSEENTPLFAAYIQPHDIVSALEALSNSQLFELTRWMGSRVTSARAKSAVDEEHEKALNIASFLEEKYGAIFSVRAGHMKQIARILRNRVTDFDPDYLANTIQPAGEDVR